MIVQHGGGVFTGCKEKRWPEHDLAFSACNMALASFFLVSHVRTLFDYNVILHAMIHIFKEIVCLQSLSSLSCVSSLYTVVH